MLPGTLSFFCSHNSIFQLLDMPWSHVSSLLPPSSFYRAQGFSISHRSSIFHRLLLTHALALSASQLYTGTDGLGGISGYPRARYWSVS